jgi:hypothetical protein
LTKDSTRPVVFQANREFLEILASADPGGDLNRNFVLESPGVIKDVNSQRLFFISKTES